MRGKLMQVRDVHLLYLIRHSSYRNISPPKGKKLAVHIVIRNRQPGRGTQRWANNDARTTTNYFVCLYAIATIVPSPIADFCLKHSTKSSGKKKRALVIVTIEVIKWIVGVLTQSDILVSMTY